MKAVIRSKNDAIRFVGRIVAKLGEEFDKPWTIYVTPFRRRKTLEQNAKYHAMIHDIALSTGHSNSEIKNFVKAEYGPSETLDLGGRHKTIPKSVSKYSVTEMSDAIEMLYMLGAELGVEWSENEPV